MVLKLVLGCWYYISPAGPEGPGQPEEKDKIFSWEFIGRWILTYKYNLKRKKRISTPLMMENPVRSPIVPPIRLNWAPILIFLSLSMLSKVAVSKQIWTSWRVDFTSSSPVNCGQSWTEHYCAVLPSIRPQSFHTKKQVRCLPIPMWINLFESLFPIFWGDKNLLCSWTNQLTCMILKKKSASSN